MRKLLLSLVLATALGQACSAATYYIAQSAGTFSGGSACNGQPTMTPTAFNSTQLNPGDTAYICGTITGTAGQQLILITASGTSGNPITLIFDSGANLTAPYWASSGAILVKSSNWITIDGGTNGIIQNTANGTALAYQQPSEAVAVITATNVTVKNLTVANMCQRPGPMSDTNGCQTSGNGDNGIAMATGLTNVTITNNTIHDTQIGVLYISSAGDSGIVISNNTISRTNWDIGVGAAGISNSLLITGNDLSCVVGGPCNWTDTSASNAFHHNGVMIFPQGTGDQVEGLVISNNFIHDINPCTGGIFLDPLSGDEPGAQMYNNVFYTTPGQPGPANYWIVAGASNAITVNNTIVGSAGASIGLNPVSPTSENNILTTAYSYYFMQSGYTGVTSDYNLFYGATSMYTPMFVGYGYPSVAAYVTATGFDKHSITTNPNLTPSFTLSAGSPAIKAGKNLTSLGIAGLNVGAPQSFGAGGSCGMGCQPRPATGPWDIGAYQTASGPRPNAPTGLSTQGQ